MKSKEFTNESAINNWHERGIPGMKSLTGVDQYYDLYRFGLAMAGAGRKEHPLLGEPDGVTEDNPTTLSYTQAEEDIVNAGLKRIGATATQITSRTSKEPTDTYTQSPMHPKGPVKRKKS